MEPDQAAARMLAHMQSARFSTSFPTAFSWLFRISRIMPDWLYFRCLPEPGSGLCRGCDGLAVIDDGEMLGEAINPLEPCTDQIWIMWGSRDASRNLSVKHGLHRQ